MKIINKEHIRNIILSYIQLLAGFGFCFIALSIINKYYSTVLLTFLLEVI